MKKFIIFLFFTALVISVQAQDTTRIRKTRERKIIIIHKSNDSLPDSKDTIEINTEDTDIDIPEIPDLPDMPPRRIPAVIDEEAFSLGFTNLQRGTSIPFGISGYSDFPELNNAKSLAIGFGQNWGFNVIKGKLRLWTGLRYDIRNYRFSDADVRLQSGGNFVYTTDSSGISTKSKVVVNYIGVPLAIGYQANPRHLDEGFSIRAGVNAGYRVRTHSKVKTSNGKKEKEFDDFSFNDFALTPFVEIGYNSIALYARYSVTPVFKDGKGPEANAFEFGIVLQ